MCTFSYKHIHVHVHVYKHFFLFHFILEYASFPTCDTNIILTMFKAIFVVSKKCSEADISVSVSHSWSLQNKALWYWHNRYYDIWYSKYLSKYW